MKDKFIKEQERLVNEAVEAFMDDDYQLQEYYDSLKTDDSCGCNNDCPCMGEPATQEEVQANHNDWWDSLTDEQKEQLYKDHQEAEDYFNNNIE